MGCYDEISIPCPKCAEVYIVQSKGGECCFKLYSLENAPNNVLNDVNRHAPYICEKCGTLFYVQKFIVARSVIYSGYEDIENE